MRVIYGAVLAAWLLAGTGLIFGQTGPPPEPGGISGPTASKWVRMFSLKGGVTALVPPTLMTSGSVTRDTEAGPLVVTTLKANEGRFRFYIAYFDYPDRIEAEKNARTLLDGSRRGLVASLKGTLSDVRDLTLDGHPGLAFRLTAGDGKTVLIYRAFMVGQRLFQFLVETDTDSANAQEVGKFLDSCALWSPNPGESGHPPNPTVDISYGVGDPGSGPPRPDPPSVTADGRLRIPSEGVMRARATSRVTPEYPPDVYKKGIQGSVVVEIRIDEAGNVTDARIESGPPELHARVVAAAKRWTFQPFLMNGKAVKAIGFLTFRFNLSKE